MPFVARGVGGWPVENSGARRASPIGQWATSSRRKLDLFDKRVAAAVALTSKRPRELNIGTYVYTLGLEHTGHHLWETALPVVDKVFSDFLYLAEIDSARQKAALNHTAFTASLQVRFKWQDMIWALDEHVPRWPPPPIVSIPSCSYPCGTLGNKKDPDRMPITPLLLAEAARASDVRIRFLVLTRPPEEARLVYV